MDKNSHPPSKQFRTGLGDRAEPLPEDLDELLEDFVEASAAVVSALSEVPDRVGGPFSLSVLLRRIADRAEKIRQNKRPGHSVDSE